MSGNSRAIQSNQLGLHKDLDKVVQRHLQHPFRKPYQQHTLQAFLALEKQVEASNKPIIFDSCCGVGESTYNLALRHPEALVVGMDKSAHRLARHPNGAVDNYLLLQVDLNDLWRLAVEAEWRLTHHYLLYPNPWPKSRHLQRRWHGSAVFPALMRLGGQLELRSNWPLYLQEFQRALDLAGEKSVLQAFSPEQPLTPFERKYQASGQALWQLCAQLAQAS